MRTKLLVLIRTSFIAAVLVALGIGAAEAFTTSPSKAGDCFLNCQTEDDPEFYCVVCCDALGSVCLFNGQCLCG